MIDSPKLAPPPAVSSATDLIGNTPMLELRRIEAGDRAAVFAKLEWFSPGGSVKDRVGLGLIRWAEDTGRLQPGATLVEPTAGNTGIGLALVGIQRGYHVILVVPERFSIEKQKLMEALGGTVVRTPTADGMLGAIQKAHEIAAEIPGAYVPQQFESPGNPEIHYRTTGPEIWQQVEGKLDAVVIGAGSGGTVSGVARFLKEQDPHIRVFAVEPEGSTLGGGLPGRHEVEGIGTTFIPKVMDLDRIDEILMVPDRDAFTTVQLLARAEGLLVGGSSGANCHAALRVARRLGVGKRLVTIFPDGAERYLSKGHLNRPVASDADSDKGPGA